MKIVGVSIYNLRSIKVIEDLDLSKGLDVLIGQNDSGKSTVLYGLDFFFNNEKVCQFQDDQNNKNDLSFHAIKHFIVGDMAVEADEIAVLCRFQLDEIDSKQERSELAKFSNGGIVSVLKKCCREERFEAARSKKASVYFLLKDAFRNDDFNDLSSKKEDELIALMEKYPDSKEYLQNINKVGKPENIERIAALLTYARKTQVSTAKFEKASFGAKGSPDIIWPEFSLIDTRTSLDGKHKVIEDAFKKIDSEIEKKFKSTIDTIKTDARTEYDKITEKIKDYAQKNYIPQIEEFSARPSVKLSIGRDLVMKRVGQKEASHFDLQGDGTKRRMMVAILQTSANVIVELSAGSKEEEVEDVEAEYIPLRIWAFDEPEMHLHPGAQRDLYNSFQKFKSEGFQIICSTHSTVFVDNSNLASVHLIQLNDDLETIEVRKSLELEQVIKQSLGVKNSDVFYSNLFVVFEGATEYVAFPVLYGHLVGQDIRSAGVTMVDGGGWTETKEKIVFLTESLGNAVCLFDTDVKTKLGNELSDLETAGLIKFIGTADFEDSFSNQIWLPLLQSDYNLNDARGTSIWSEAKLNELRGQISQTDNNKKFFELLKRHYESKFREMNGESTSYPVLFDKKEVGKKLADTAVSLNVIPQPIKDFVEVIKSKI